MVEIKLKMMSKLKLDIMEMLMLCYKNKWRCGNNITNEYSKNRKVNIIDERKK